MRTLKTNNESWGFYGTVITNRTAADEAEADQLFKAACNYLIKNGGFTPAKARDALDSTIGRHIADNLYDAADLAKSLQMAIDKRWFRKL
jgi:hypothetical protein